MPTGEQRTHTGLSRSVTAAIRARLAVMRRSIRWLAGEVGVSPSYLASRLRDDSPLTVDDLAHIVAAIDPSQTPGGFVAQALQQYPSPEGWTGEREKTPRLPEQPVGEAHQLGDGAPTLEVEDGDVTLTATPQPARAPGRRSTRSQPGIGRSR